MASQISNFQWMLKAQRMQDQLDQHDKQASSSFSSPLPQQASSPQPFNARAATATATATATVTLLSSVTQPDMETDSSMMKTANSRYRPSVRPRFGSEDFSRPAPRAVWQTFDAVSGYSDMGNGNANANASLSAQSSLLNNKHLSPFPMSRTSLSDYRTPLRPYSLHEFAQSKNMPVSRVEPIPKQRRGSRSTGGSEVCLFESNPLQSRMAPETIPIEQYWKSRPQPFARSWPSKIMRQQNEVLDLGSDGEAEVEKKDRCLISSGEKSSHQDMVSERIMGAERAATSQQNTCVNGQEINSAQGSLLQLHHTQFEHVSPGVIFRQGGAKYAPNNLPLGRIFLTDPKARQDQTEIQIPGVELPISSTFATQQVLSLAKPSLKAHSNEQRITEDVIVNRSGSAKRKCADDENDENEEHMLQNKHIPKNGLEVPAGEMVFNKEAYADKISFVTPSHANMKSTKNAIASDNSPKGVGRASHDELSMISTELAPLVRPETQLEEKPIIKESGSTVRKEHVERTTEGVLSSPNVVSDKRGEHLSTASPSKVEDPAKEQAPFIPHDDGQSLFVQDSSDEDDLGSILAKDDDINTSQPVLLSREERKIQGATKCAKKGKHKSNPLCKIPKTKEDYEEISQRQQELPLSPNGRDKNTQGPKAFKKRNSDKSPEQRPRNKPHHIEPGDIKKMRQFRNILKARQRIPVVFMNNDDCTANTVSFRSEGIERSTLEKIDGQSAEKTRDPKSLFLEKSHTMNHTDENGEVQRHPDESPLGNVQSKCSVNTITSKRVDETVIATKNAERNESNSRVSEASANHKAVESKSQAISLGSANQNDIQTEPLENVLEGSSGARCIADERDAKIENTRGPHLTSLPNATTVGRQCSIHSEGYAHRNPSGHNFAHDVLIYELRGEERQWKEVQEIFERRTGRHLSRKVLSSRYKVAARYFENNIEGQKERIYFEKTEPHFRETLDIKLATAADSSEIEAGSSRKEINVHPYANHTVTGTKSWNNKVFQAYLKTIADEAANEDEQDDGDSDSDNGEAKAAEALTSVSSGSQEEPARPESPITSGDVCCWEYQIKRKNWLTDLAHGDSDSDSDSDEQEAESLAQWIVVGSKTYSSLQQANYAAGQEVLRERDGCALGPDIRQWTYHLNEDDMAEYYGSSYDNRRHFKVIVDRFLRNPTRGLLPDSKMGWLSKKVYEIKQRTVEVQDISDRAKVSGNGTEESESLLPVSGSDDEEVLDGLYTILDQANREAGRIVLNLTTKPDSNRIDDQIHRVEAQKQMREKLDQLEISNSTFTDTVTLPENRKIMIWVEQRELKGPRNI